MIPFIPTMIFQGLRRYWKELAILALIAAAYFYVNGLHNTIRDQAEQIRVAQINNDTLSVNNARLEATVTEANKTIAMFDQFVTATKNGFAALDKTVKSNTSSLSAKLQSILAENPPQTCEEAIAYLIQAQKEYTK